MEHWVDIITDRTVHIHEDTITIHLEKLRELSFVEELIAEMVFLGLKCTGKVGDELRNLLDQLKDAQ